MSVVILFLKLELIIIYNNATTFNGYSLTFKVSLKPKELILINVYLEVKINVQPHLCPVYRLPEYCKKIQEKEKERKRNRYLSSSEDEGPGSADEDDFHHPFSVKESGPITFDIPVRHFSYSCLNMTFFS